MSSKYILCIVLIVITGFSEADFVFWFHDLTELPEYWTQNGFTFNSSGAYTHLWDEGWPDSKSYNWLKSDYLMIPPDLDSLVIDVSQFVTLFESGDISDYAKVTLYAEFNGCETVELWTRYIDDSDPQKGSLTDSLPIHATMADLNAGDLIQFIFLAEVSAGWHSYVELDWWLWDAQLTGYGMLSLVPRTWAGIKSAF